MRRSDKPEIVKLLLDAKADPNVKRRFDSKMSIHDVNSKDSLACLKLTLTALKASARERLATDLKDSPNLQLDRIMRRMDLERPFTLREKVTRIIADKEAYKDKNHSLEKFNKLKRLVEKKRLRRR